MIFARFSLSYYTSLSFVLELVNILRTLMTSSSNNSDDSSGLDVTLASLRSEKATSWFSDISSLQSEIMSVLISRWSGMKIGNEVAFIPRWQRSSLFWSKCFFLSDPVLNAVPCLKVEAAKILHSDHADLVLTFATCVEKEERRSTGLIQRRCPSLNLVSSSMRLSWHLRKKKCIVSSKSWSRQFWRDNRTWLVSSTVSLADLDLFRQVNKSISTICWQQCTLLRDLLLARGAVQERPESFYVRTGAFHDGWTWLFRRTRCSFLQSQISYFSLCFRCRYLT